MFSSTLSLPKVNLDWFERSCEQMTRVVEDHHQTYWSQERDPVTGEPWVGTPDLEETGSMFSTTVFGCKGGLNKGIFATVHKPYGKYHQYGTQHIPQRRWLGLNSLVYRELEGIIKRHIFS